MKRYKLAAFLIAIFCVFSMSVSAEKITDLGDSGIASIDLPDGSEVATRSNCSQGLLDMLQIDKASVDQSMAAGGLYVLSFGNDGKSIVQYTLSSRNNPGMPGGNINALTNEQFSSFTTNVKNFLESDGTTKIENTSQIKSGEYTYLCLDGSTTDEVNGSKLYFRTYATVQNDNLVMLRAMNYSMTQFDDAQKNSLDSVAKSITYTGESVPPQIVQTPAPAPTEQKPAEPEKKAKSTEAPKQTQTQAQPPVQTQAVLSTVIPQEAVDASSSAPTQVDDTENAKNTKKTGSAKKADKPDNEKKGSALPVICITAAVIIIAGAVVFIIIKKKKKK